MAAEKSNPQFEALIDHVQRERGLDFRGYKRPSLRRRVEKCMGEVGIPDFETYMGFLEAHPGEYGRLLDTILINVTSFFRDSDAWEVLRKEVIPRILETKSDNDPVRVWSAGCASGEEPYSLAMLLAEAMGEERYGRCVKIYATDLDEDALTSGRRAEFSAKAVEPVPSELLEKCFEARGEKYVFRRDLRKAVIFGKHDIVHNAPISNIDLLVCRNVLIYLDSDTQERVLPRLYYALTNNGFLFLGKAETLLMRSTLFKPVRAKTRIFTKITGSSAHDNMVTLAIGADRNAITERAGRRDSLRAVVTSAIVDRTPVAHIVVGAKDEVLLANPRAVRLFSIGESHLGRPFYDLEISRYPVKLRGHIAKAADTGETVRLDDCEWHPREEDEVRYLSMDITPIMDDSENYCAAVLSFYDVTDVHSLRRQLEAASEDLQTLNEEFQCTNEELETANEELQSTNEELETTNEELQSSNEELETMNEELQSTNEELEATNEQLRNRTEELTSYRSFTEARLSSVPLGVIAVDADLNVDIWNRWDENTWGLRRDEVLGRNLFELDFGLPTGKFRQQIKKVLGGEAPAQDTELEAMNRRGRPFTCRILISPLQPPEQRNPSGVILVAEDVTERNRMETDLRRFATVVRDSNDAITLHGFNGRILAWNRGAERMYGYTSAEALAMNIRDIVPPEERGGALKMAERLGRGEIIDAFRTKRVAKDGRVIDVWLTCTMVADAEGKPEAIATTERDIAAAKQLLDADR